MTYVIDLPPPVEARLEQEARSAGITPSELLANVVRKSFEMTIDPIEQQRLNLPSVVLLESWLAKAEEQRSPEDEADAEEDMEELMRNLNAPRRESRERLHFPDASDKP